MRVRAAGVELAVYERGAGPAVLLIHGMADDATGWRAVAEALAGAGARAIAYDRRGYGESTAPEPYGATTVEEQAEDAAAVLRARDAAPALVAGRDLGALVALDLLKRHAPLVRGAAVVDPPLYAFVPEAAEALSEERRRLQDTVGERGPAAAVDEWRARHGRLGAAGDRNADGKRAGAGGEAAARAFFADYAGLATWPVTRRELRAIAVPVAVLTSAGAARHTVAAAEALAGRLPTVTRRHDDDVAAALIELLAG